ncbi:hypothetical protein EZS27_034593, partial [termite gut metagenome]
TNFYGLDEKQTLGNDETSKLITEGISANSTAFLDYSDPEKVKTLGNPTEAALLLWLNSIGIKFGELRENAKVEEQLTFSTERKYMATLVDSPLLGKRVLYIKGAPEIVLSKCADVREKTAIPVSGCKKKIEEQLFQYQNQAMRTLGFAYKFIDEGTNMPIKDLVEAGMTFLGITAISDPVRADVSQAVATCLNAGIDLKIVTGDTPGTAREIARQIGIWQETDTEQNIITGVEFEALSDAEAAKRVKALKVMCRARPTDKQRLVHLLQQGDEIVAVTGDGTNDAPALNYAHVGLSMGTGTSVAKEASDITLLDDSFGSISTAVMWGRSLYQNIQRFNQIFDRHISTLIYELIRKTQRSHRLILILEQLFFNLLFTTRNRDGGLLPYIRTFGQHYFRRTFYIQHPFTQQRGINQRRHILSFGRKSKLFLYFGILSQFPELNTYRVQP